MDPRDLAPRADRLTFLRLAGVTSAAAFVGGKYLGDPAEAWAMNPKFDRVQTLAAGGTVCATGPTNFADDEVRAIVSAHVAQAGRIQSGTSEWFGGRRGTWSVVLAGPALKRGPADAYGLAYVQNRDGTYEWYPWEVAVTLR